jgi:lantibiotic biosynthesis protein
MRGPLTSISDPSAKRAGTGRPSLFEPLDWALARASLLPIEAYPRMSDSEARDGEWVVDETLESGTGWLSAAVAIGSPDLFSALTEGAATKSPSASAQRALHRYRIRMTTRPTPYGLFAGVGLATWGPATDLRIGPGEPRTRTRPDMEWLWGLVIRLERDIEVRRALRLVAHPARLERAGRLFMPEPSPDQKGVTRPAFSIRATDVVRQALETARTPIEHEALATALIAATGASRDRVEGLIGELCEREVLISDLRPPLTCASPARYVSDRLGQVAAANVVARELDEVLTELERFDSLALSDRPAALRPIVGRIRALHALPAAAAGLQVDVVHALAGRRVHAAVAAEAAAAAELLLRLSPYPDGLPHMNAYRDAFQERYGVGRSVPLLELLDPQFGLGSPESRGPGAAVDRERQVDREQTLQDLAVSALRDRVQVVELDDAVIARLETWSPGAGGAPLSLDISAFIAATSAAAVDAGCFQLVVGPNVGASGAGRNMGRFAEVIGANAVAALERVAEAETRDGGRLIRAEVVYAPDPPRLSNVAIRPAIRRHEIALGTQPGVPWDQVISVNDLVVSLRAGRFVIAWPAAEAELAVVQGHMLSPSRAPALVRFLLDASADRQVQLSPFSWESASTFPFLPRIQRGRVILTLAQWRIRVGEGPGGLSPEPADRFAEALARWRAQWEGPRWTYLTVGDNRLLLDLDDAASRELLRHELRRLPKRGSLVLQEALPGPEHAWLAGPLGHHLLELNVPVRRRATASAPPGVATDPRVHRPLAALASRVRPPGSDWLYLKLYGPETLHDDLISGPLQAIAQFALSMGVADQWFFLRYADPEPHLRIRFHGDPSRLHAELLGHLCAWARDLVAEGACSRFSVETYERELERFGGEPGMTLAEAIFAADSVAVARLLQLGRRQPGGIDWLPVAMLTIDDLLAALGEDEPARLAWYRAEVSISPEDGRDYRARRSALRRLLEHRDAELAPAVNDALDATLAARRQALAALAADLDAVVRDGRLDAAALYASHVHLHSNRLLGMRSDLEPRALQLLRRTREAIAHSTTVSARIQGQSIQGQS